MAIYKIEYTEDSDIEWGYWVEGESSSTNTNGNTYWLITKNKRSGSLNTSNWERPISGYTKTFSRTVRASHRLKGVTLGGLFQHLHDITEGTE